MIRFGRRESLLAMVVGCGLGFIGFLLVGIGFNSYAGSSATVLIGFLLVGFACLAVGAGVAGLLLSEGMGASTAARPMAPPPTYPPTA